MSLEFEPCTLTFSQLHYMVPLPPQQADSPNAITSPSGARELELLKVGLHAACPQPSMMSSASMTQLGAGAAKGRLARCLPTAFTDELCKHDAACGAQGISGAFRPHTLTALMGAHDPGLCMLCCSLSVSPC